MLNLAQYLTSLQSQLFTLSLWSFVGALIRILFEMYTAYQTFGSVLLDKKRVAIDAIASLVFGTLGVFFLVDVGVIHSKGVLFGQEAVAVVGGLFGVQVLKRVGKWLGVGLPAGMRPSVGVRQQKALEYVQKFKVITNDAYQKLTGVSDSTAARELKKLTSQGLLHRIGSNRGIKYTNGS